MTERTNWLRTRTRIGWLLLSAGLAILAASLVAARLNPNAGFNFNILGGAGIAVGGLGLAYLVRYGLAVRNEAVARRVVVEERDERGVTIRQRAGSRAYWVSALLVYVGLMWSSFAANGQLPALEGDVLWDFLALAVLVPFGVYGVSVVLDERHS